MHSCKDETLQDSSWCIQKGTQEVWRPHYLWCCGHIQGPWWRVGPREGSVGCQRLFYGNHWCLSIWQNDQRWCSQSSEAVHQRQEGQTGLLWSCSTIHWSNEWNEDSNWSLDAWKTSNQFDCRENEPIHSHSYFYMPVGSWITTMFLENSNPLRMSSTQRRTQRWWA